MQFVKNICYYEADNIYQLGGKYQYRQSSQSGMSLAFLGKILDKERERKRDYSSRKIHLLSSAEISLTLRMGRCAEQCDLLACYLLARGFDDFKFVKCDGHVFVITKFQTGGNLLNPETIPPEAMVVDPWASECYPAKEFANRSNKSLLNANPVITEWKTEYPESEHTPVAQISEVCRNLIVNYINKNIGKNRLPDLPTIDFIVSRSLAFHGYTIAEFEAIKKNLDRPKWDILSKLVFRPLNHT